MKKYIAFLTAGVLLATATTAWFLYQSKEEQRIEKETREQKMKEVYAPVSKERIKELLSK